MVWWWIATVVKAEFEGGWWSTPSYRVDKVMRAW